MRDKLVAQTLMVSALLPNFLMSGMLWLTAAHAGPQDGFPAVLLPVDLKASAVPSGCPATDTFSYHRAVPLLSSRGLLMITCYSNWLGVGHVAFSALS